MRIAILGAECTGKTHLAQELVTQLRDDFPAVAWQPDALRQWREANGRQPLAHELETIAREHMAHILHHPVETLLLCDTTPLMTAVYSDVVFGDTSLHAWALEQHRAFSFTLLTGLDLPWVVDGVRLHTPEMRHPTDQCLREVLQKNRIDFSSVYGVGPVRAQQARLSILRGRGHGHDRTPDTQPSNWRWNCEKCSDADCEHQLFSGLLKPTH